MRQPPFKLGETVLVNRGGSFVPATITRTPGKAPDMRRVLVTYEDGRPDDVHVSSCHRDSAEFRTWRASLERKEAVAQRLIKICRREGYSFAGAACQRLAEWAEYGALAAQVQATGRDAFAVHPYGY
jgi:hypothetical protein